MSERENAAELCDEIAEQAVLAAILCWPESLDSVRGRIGPDAFARRSHAAIFAAYCALADDGVKIDPVTVLARLTDRGDLELAGGSDYIAFLIDAIGSVANVAQHADIVREIADRRSLVQAAKTLIECASDRRIPAAAAAEQARAEISTATSARRCGFSLFDLAELQSMPEPVWIVERAIPARATVGLVGPTRHYKTFVALDLAARISIGLEWHGRKTRRGPVVFIAGEGASGIRKRLTGWQKYYGAEPDVLVLPHSLDFSSAGDISQLLGAISVRVPDGQVALVVVDTLNRNMPGDENAPEYHSRFMKSADAIRAATGATVMVIHHTGHAATGEGVAKIRARGSSSFTAGLDAEFLCAQSNGGDRVELMCSKQKDDVDGWTVEFEVVPFYSTLVLKTGGVASAKLTGQRLQSLLVLHRDFGPDGAKSGEWQEATGFGNSSFQDARKWLQNNDYVRHGGQRYTLTDGAHMALASHTSSSCSSPSPVPLQSPSPTTPPLRGGSLEPPEGEVDQPDLVDFSEFEEVDR